MISERVKSLHPEGRRLIVDTAFQPNRLKEWMAYPYITIQLVGKLAPNRPVTEQEFHRLVAGISSASKMPKMQATVANMARHDAHMLKFNEFVDSVSKAKIYSDTDRRKYWFLADNPVAGESMVSVIGGTVVSSGMLVQMNGACKKNELKSFVPVFLKMFDSVRDF